MDIFFFVGFFKNNNIYWNSNKLCGCWTKITLRLNKVLSSLDSTRQLPEVGGFSKSSQIHSFIFKLLWLHLHLIYFQNSKTNHKKQKPNQKRQHFCCVSSQSDFLTLPQQHLYPRKAQPNCCHSSLKMPGNSVTFIGKTLFRVLVRIF